MQPRQSSSITRSNVAIFSIQIGIATTYIYVGLIPPRAVLHNRTVASRPHIIIAIFRAELLTVVPIQAITY